MATSRSKELDHAPLPWGDYVDESLRTFERVAELETEIGRPSNLASDVSRLLAAARREGARDKESEIIGALVDEVCAPKWVIDKLRAATVREVDRG